MKRNLHFFFFLPISFSEGSVSGTVRVHLRLDSNESCLGICTAAAHQITQSEVHLFFITVGVRHIEYSLCSTFIGFPSSYRIVFESRCSSEWKDGCLSGTTCTDLWLQLFLNSLCTTDSYSYSVLFLLFKKYTVWGTMWPSHSKACYILMKLILYFPKF